MKRVLYALLIALAVLPLVAGPALAAWPLTPLTSYMANTAPAIKAFDLNQFQDAINKGFLGTYSYRGLVIDGTGGSVVGPTPGSVVVTRQVTANATPTPSAGGGELARGLAPACWAQVNSAGLFVRGANILSVARNALGDYKVVCHATPTSFTGAAPMATLTNADGPRMITAAVQDDGAGRLQINVKVRNTGNVVMGVAQLIDENFQVVAFVE